MRLIPLFLGTCFAFSTMIQTKVTGPNVGPGKLATWGYRVYRTVYTPEFDTAFPIVVERLRTIVEKSVRDSHPYSDTQARLEMEEGLQFVFTVLQDKELFNNASIAQLRAHFRSDPDTSPLLFRSSLFLVIDEEVIRTMPTLLTEDTFSPWVRMVDSTFDPEAASMKPAAGEPTPEEILASQRSGELPEEEQWYDEDVVEFAQKLESNRHHQYRESMPITMDSLYNFHGELQETPYYK